jgi:RNA polymerase sigma-70 factor (ECF subfamily)
MDLATASAAPAAIDLEAELVGLYPALHRRLTLVLRDATEAEDVAQATFAKAIEGRSRFDGADVRAWVYTIGLRLAFNELRRRRRAPVAPLPDASAEATGAGEPAWAMSADPDLWIALADLPLEHRAALVLSTLEGYTHAEIGSMLGVAEGTVSSWLSRTKAHLRSVLGDEE